MSGRVHVPIAIYHLHGPQLSWRMLLAYIRAYIYIYSNKFNLSVRVYTLNIYTCTNVGVDRPSSTSFKCYVVRIYAYEHNTIDIIYIYMYI